MPVPTSTRTKLWLDCDPGRDDAVAILFALHLPQLELLGLSSVYGNASLEMMTLNCVRLLCSYGSPEQARTLPVAQGSRTPLVRSLGASAGGIHGATGLDGVSGLLDMSDPLVAKLQESAVDRNAVLAMAEAMRALPEGEQMVLVATGPFTNVALVCAAFPDLVRQKVERIVVMGGAEGRGNKSPVAEANVLGDPHAAAMILNFNVPVIMISLNLTHTCLFTPDVHRLLLDPASAPAPDDAPLPPASTVLRGSMSSNMTEYALAYKTKYGFPGPPCHDAVTVAYLARPDLFKGTRYRVDVELNEGHTFGATVVDLWEYKKASIDQDPDNWGANGRNVLWLEEVDAKAFWHDIFLPAVASADAVCPINV